MIFAVACLAAAFILASAILAAVAVLIARTERREARAAIDQVCGELEERLWDMPVPYRLAEDLEILADHATLLAALCDPCNGGTGDCICPQLCGQLECMGGLSDEAVAFLKGLTMPEGTDQ